MTRYHVLGALSALVVAGVGVACGNGGTGTGGNTGSGNPASSGAGTGTGTGTGTGGQTAGTGGGQTTGTGAGPTTATSGSASTGTGGSPQAPSLCPDSISNPKKANSVQVTDLVIQTDTVWDASHVYLVAQSLDVDKAKLTIQAGTTVCLGAGVVLSVGAQNASAILIQGTPSQHVVFTAADDGTGNPDFWGGIDLNNFPGSTLSYLDIHYAASGSGSTTWAFQMSGAIGQPFLLDHLTIDGVRTGGYRVGPNGLASGSVIDFKGFYPAGANPPQTYATAQVQVETSATFNDPSVTLTFDTAKIPAASRYIAVDSLDNIIKSSLVWNDLGLPYRIPNGLAIYGDYTKNTVVNLTLNAGVTLQLEGNLVVGNTQYQGQPDVGNLIVKGTAQKPVVFTSRQVTPAAGDWGAVYFVQDSFEPAVTVIDHAQLMYGGADNPGAMVASCQDTGDSHAGLISIDGSGLNGLPFVGPTITNSAFSHSQHDGIRSHFAPKNLTQDRIDKNYGDPMYGNTFTAIAGHPFLDPTDPTADKCM